MNRNQLPGLVVPLLAIFLLPAMAAAESTAPRQDMASKVMAQALPWDNKEYRVGSAEQCMNWTREVLVAACGKHFATIETQEPWDGHLLGPDDELLPEHVDSLAADEFGEKIIRLEDLQAGDLVFLKNTYGDWAEGVLTHVGIALGDGSYIHRMTSNDGIVRIDPIPSGDFDSGIRLKESLCYSD
ncbi:MULTISPECIES: NlpC/P60 family protein [Microbulbifer]|uniref:NlpC/P60 family protein n=1 Tax=Microbulbifer TaxID=48073 RepID=UPI001E2888DC|nr:MULTISPECIES: NlpC/P60 family protein [Microbulbifer]UHQ55390.1 C40 family peptidase [Microbulbifer sp. YPW16]